MEITTITNNPHADAERHNDEADAEQAAYDAKLEEAKRVAPAIVFRLMQACKRPSDWFKPNNFTGATWSADEVVNYALQHDDDSISALAELMTSPAADKLKQAAAKWFGEDQALAIMDEHGKKEGAL